MLAKNTFAYDEIVFAKIIGGLEAMTCYTVD